MPPTADPDAATPPAAAAAMAPTPSVVHHSGTERSLPGPVELCEQGLRVLVSMAGLGCCGPVGHGLEIALDPVGGSLIGGGMLAQQLVEHDSGRVDVAGHARLGSGDDLRTGVGIPTGRARVGEPGSGLHQFGGPFSVDHDRARRHAAVHDAVVVDSSEPLEGAVQHAQCLLDRQLSPRRSQRGQAGSVDPFLDQPDLVVVDDRLVAGRDIPVLNVSGRTRYLSDAVPGSGCCQSQLFERHITAGVWIMCSPDGSIAATGDLTDQVEMCDFHS